MNPKPLVIQLLDPHQPSILKIKGEVEHRKEIAVEIESPENLRGILKDH